MNSADLAFAVIVYLGLFASMVLHEIAHAVVALWLGDDTAKRKGRITLDPLPHVDPMMTILVPLLTLWLSHGTTAFGGAMPVPVNPQNLRHPRRDLMWIAVAGPASNCLIAVVLALALNAYPAATAWEPYLAGYAARLLEVLIGINLLLAGFNLIPIPPLDGSKILAGLLPEDLADAYLAFGGHQGLLVVGVLVMTGAIDVIYPPIDRAAEVFIESLTYFDVYR
jgi:Zn-dependent protease